LKKLQKVTKTVNIPNIFPDEEFRQDIIFSKAKIT
jgi:hypothetical protein